MSDTTNRALYEELKDDDLSFVYLGKFDNAVLGFATEILKGHMTMSADSEGKKNKLSFLMIESFQNILRYGLSGRANDETSGEVFIVRKHKGSYYITTGNFVENSKIGSISEKLERVNSLSPDELKKLFMETLQNKKISKEGGAGLGFMEMVRKTKEKLDFDFVEVDENRKFFYFQLRLKDEKDDVSEALPISSAKFLKNFMEQNGRYICMMGDFTQAAINPILSMAENNICDESLKTQRKLYHILVEMLQNIAKHATPTESGRHEGVFSMGSIGSDFIVSASNGVANDKTDHLENYIKQLNAMDHQQLDDYYKKVLREGHPDPSILSGLGLIDLARDSKIMIDYEFADCMCNQKLFTMTVKL
ncbi:MAG: SiaB family protein kinase [Bacteroidales bacterium]|nr:SiaB family protein kinase [Bacteroidales bacterium]